ncbi:MAG: leucine-rich repeat protein [Bacteroidales bacterium]|nr:leucine-rich repeat protein [Bacteroidales bacterium]
MNRKYILVAMVLSASVLSSCTKEKEDNFTYKEVPASQVVSDLGIGSRVVTFSITDGDGEAPADVVALNGSEIDLPAATSFGLDGYDFDGWATSYNGTPLEKDKDGKQKLKVADNTVLYAVWKVRTVQKALDAFEKGEKVPEGGKLVIEEKNLTEWEFKQLWKLFTADYFSEVNGSYTEIDLSKTEITEIPKITFANTDLKAITFPETLKTIGEEAFENCNLLESVDFEKTAIETIGKNAFRGCNALKSVVISNEIKEGDKKRDNTLKSIEEGAFLNCEALTNKDAATLFVIPASVSSIGNNAFSGTAFTKIEVGAGVKLVKSGTFGGCTSLTEITFNYNGIDKLRINPNVFYDCPALTKISYKAEKGVDLAIGEIPGNDEEVYSIGDGNHVYEVVETEKVITVTEKN